MSYSSLFANRSIAAVGASLALLLTSCVDRGFESAEQNFSAPQSLLGGKNVSADSPDAGLAVLIVTAKHIDLGNGRINKVESICSGAFVSKNIILTAAHCLNGKDSAEVVYSTNLKDPNAHRAAIVAQVTHPAYNMNGHSTDASGKLQSDLALLKVEGEKPAQYPVFTVASEAPTPPFNLTLAGYGQLTADVVPSILDPTQGSGQLRMADVVIQESHLTHNYIQFTHSSGASNCYGDSGGPAFVLVDGQYQILATSKAGLPRGHHSLCGGKSIYLNITSYKEWITSTIQELSRN